MKKKRRQLLIGGIIALLIIGIILQRKGVFGGNDETPVTLSKVGYQDIVQTVEASGKIYPETEVKIKADVSGEIVEMPVEEGDSVTKGQLLAKIDPAIYQSQVSQAEAQTEQARASVENAKNMAAQAKAQLDKAQSDFDRNQQLFKNKVISSSEFEQFKSQYLAAKASYEAAQSNISGSKFGQESAGANLSQSRESLSRTTIKAPTSGIISQLLVKKGERVVGTQQMDGSQIMTIADLGRMEVRVDVTETDIAKVNIGDSTVIRVDAYPDRKFKGVVSKIAVSSSSLNNSTTTGATGGGTDEVANYTVHILILPESYQDLIRNKKDSGYIFKPGMSAGVDIQTKRLNHVLAVPINAVTTREGSGDSNQQSQTDIPTLIFVYDPTSGKVKTKPVKTGIQDNNNIQIISGIKEGEQIVTAPYSAIARTLTDQSKVKPVPSNQLFPDKEGE